MNNKLLKLLINEYVDVVFVFEGIYEYDNGVPTVKLFLLTKNIYLFAWKRDKNLKKVK